MRSDVIGDLQEPYGAVFALVVGIDHLFECLQSIVIAVSELDVRAIRMETRRGISKCEFVGREYPTHWAAQFSPPGVAYGPMRDGCSELRRRPADRHTTRGSGKVHEEWAGVRVE